MTPFTFTHQVRTFETDSAGLLTPSSLLNILQYGAGKHADELGWSVRSLHQNGQTWVLQRFCIQINSLPKDDEVITLTTYPTGAERIQAFRDYKVEDEQGEILVLATSSWVILDLNSRRVVGVPDSVKEVSESFGPRLLQFPPERLSPFDPAENGKLTRSTEFTIRKHDLDLNRHVNNVRYMEWGIESVPESVFDHKRLKSLDIVFKAECFYGDVIISLCRPVQGNTMDAYEHMLIRTSDNKPVCLLRSEWE